MGIFGTLRHPIETFRTAPFGSSIFLVAAGEAAVMLDIAIQTDDALTAVFATTAVIGSSAMGAFGGLAVRDQLRFRRRVEERLADGLDEDYLRATTATWCGRQTVRTVLEDHEGYLDRYEQICEEQAERSRLTWLPHF